MNINIRSTVDSLKKVSVAQVVFEAITNSIQAHATEIQVYFKTKDTLIPGQKLINEITVYDNGDGFNEENIKSFNTYRSDYKQQLGAKGVGRFLYLKLFDHVNIHSLSNEILFTVDTDVEVKNIDVVHTKTVLILSSPKGKYEENITDFEKKLQDHFLPLFQLLSNENKSVEITIYLNSEEKIVVNSKEMARFDKTDFTVGDHKFELSYIIDSDITDGFYCANNRVVLKDSLLEADVRFKFFNCVNVCFILSSEYFDKNVNDERDNFSIKPRKIEQDDLFSNLSWADINRELTKKIKRLCLDQGFDIDAEAQKYLQQSLKEAPFLAHYFDTENSAVLSSEKLIENAKKGYENDKTFLRSDKTKIGNPQKYEVILHKVVQAELAEYIFDREKVINRLKALTDEAALEKEIHNLFMPQRTSNDKPQNYKSNNLWLFDDRFMTYDKVFSEAQVKDIFPELADVTKRFDLLSIISNTYDRERITDIVIIELKRPDNTITPATAEEQLLEYARYVNCAALKHKIRIWTYAFLKFSEDVENKLLDKAYNKIPTDSKYPIYYRYHEGRNVIINFMDYASLASDAHARNKTFMEILTGCSYQEKTISQKTSPLKAETLSSDS